MESMLFKMMYAAAAPSATMSEADAQMYSLLMSVGSLVVIFVFFYFAMLRPQRKKEKEQKEMRDNIQIGDEVTTIGGITGIVIRRTQDTVVIETGANKNNIRVKLWAISENATQHDAVEEGVKKKKIAPATAADKQDK